MENRFDDLTKAMAEGMPRRQALRRMGALFGGALLASVALGSKARANQNCGLGAKECFNGGRFCGCFPKGQPCPKVCPF